MIQAFLTTTACICILAAAPAVAQQQQQRPQAPQVGDSAPNFTIKSLDGEETFELKAFRGKRPVILFFGSYT